jgi:hypothetical protein
MYSIEGGRPALRRLPARPSSVARRTPAHVVRRVAVTGARIRWPGAVVVLVLLRRLVSSIVGGISVVSVVILLRYIVVIGWIGVIDGVHRFVRLLRVLSSGVGALGSLFACGLDEGGG